MPESTPPSLTDLQKWSDAAAACNRCGFCTSFCPTYKVTGNEALSPRGRNQLVRGMIEGKVEVTPGLADSINTCLLCGECTSVCFSEVPTAKLMIAARDHLNRVNGIPRPLRFALEKLLPNPKLFRLLLKISFVMKKMGFALLIRALGLMKKFPIIEAADEQLPDAPLRFLLEHASVRARTVQAMDEARARAEKAAAKSGATLGADVRPRVAFFPACGEQYARPSTGLSTLRLMERLKIPVAVPTDLCCGLPAASYGVLHSVRAFARVNIERIEAGNYEAILVDDSSCGAHIREYPSYFTAEPEWKRRAEALVAKVRDVNELLIERGLKDVLAVVKWSGTPVAFHDPCKSQYGTKLTRPPRELLQSIPGLTIVPVTEADQCCGGAGAFAVMHAELSRDIVAAKAAHVRASGCGILVTSSVSCLIQLAAGLRRADSKAEVMHIVEFLDRAITRGR